MPLYKANSMMLMQRMMSTMTRIAKRNEIVEFIVRRRTLLEAAKFSRVIPMMNHQTATGTTDLTRKIITLKNGLFVPTKPFLVLRFKLNGLEAATKELGLSTQIFSMSNLLQLFGTKFKPVVLRVFKPVLMEDNSPTVVAGFLRSRDRLIKLGATSTYFLSIVLHPFRVSSCRGVI